MDFQSAIDRVKLSLRNTGTRIDTNDYDGIIVKRLSDSNTLDEGRTTNQTHIAITGEQMDIFPYLRSEGYFNGNSSDPDLKKYFITPIQIALTDSNLKYLKKENHSEDGNRKFQTFTTVIRSKRKDQADQIQVSLINLDGADFVEFRRYLHAQDYLIILKLKSQFKYEAYGISSSESQNLDELHNCFFKLPTHTLVQATMGSGFDFDRCERVGGGSNILLYGVPGSGKSWTIEHEYCKPSSRTHRLVFHPDYTYSDFVGQILPSVSDDGQVSYEFSPGPFTSILKDAYQNPNYEYILIIEEINRGNAPAIFGEIFQLLDRKEETIDGEDEGIPIGTSEYGITNANIAKIVYGDPKHEVRIPSNLSIIGTMNTSDQNVFTLDTAFQRRWEMRLIENNFENVDQKFANAEILDTGVTWEVFCNEINNIIVSNNIRMSSSEDKRLGAYFVRQRDLNKDERMGDLTSGEYDELREKESSGILSDDDKKRLFEIREAMKNNRRFPEKVIKYLWDDAFKFNREVVFETTEFKSLESVIRAFMYAEGIGRLGMFKQNIIEALQNSEGETEE